MFTVCFIICIRKYSILTVSQFFIGDKHCNYNTDTPNYLLCAAIRFIVTTNNLIVSLEKVAAHTGIYLNEQADLLAKRGQQQECFAWNYDTMDNLPHTLTVSLGNHILLT